MRERHHRVRRRLSAALALGLAMAVPFAGAHAQDTAGPDYARFVPALVEGYAAPATAALGARLQLLGTEIDTACEGGARDGFAEAFRAAVAAQAHLAVLRAGALADDNRLERLAFIPDGRGVVRRQVTRLIAAREESALDAQSLRGKSVALQGLTALEWAAFDGDGDVLLGETGEEGAYRCAYARALAVRMTATTAEVARTFAEPSGQTALLLSAGPGNALAVTHKEAAGHVFNALMTSLELVRDQMVAPLLGDGLASVRAARVPFSRSRSSIAYLSGAIRGLNDAIQAAGFAAAVDDAAWIGNTLAFETDNAGRALDAVPADLEAALADDEASGRLAYVHTILTGLRATLAGELAGHLDFRGGFNALDGD
ncbi:imelysin family protein [Stappia sp.]|uniref:imelysin family protein n=1 Tax=Stappia sp. TaxID=1870903 RepID=UPI003D0B22D2